MKKIFNYTTTGVGIGALAYLLVLISVQTTNPKAIISLLIMSALIGLTAMVYELEQLPIGKRWGLHFLAVIALVVMTLAFHGWLTVQAIILTSLLYALVFWGIYYLKGARHA